ncbi:MAG TPA: hypothetical protein DEP28_00545 [Bacteroidetes bacterium]|nr:T9SS type A sorting domain-containing protein [Ignavibacteria bacterium]HCA41720.1 hypothetical protein [Bacteroidota bacterium]
MSKLISSIFIFTFLFTNQIFSQWKDSHLKNSESNIVFNEKYFVTESSIQNSNNIISNRTAQDWRNAIDSVWGPGLSTTEKLRIFDSFWNKIDSSFACFNNITDNWLSLKQIHRPEVAAGVSRGRFAAIMSILSLALKEVHTKAQDNGVLFQNWNDPVFYIGGWGLNRFGAGITPLPDSSLLVYKVVPNHPLGLQPGDIILGYDGIKWNTLAHQMLSYQLPVRGLWGSSPSSFAHSLLLSAGVNYHLFETIDIKKAGTDEIISLPTNLMLGFNTNISLDEQMDIPGIPKPDYTSGEYVTYGILSGTNIGYIYCVQWSGNASAHFYNAVNSLKNTNGLILDFRTNFGGNMFLSDSALKILFASEIPTIDWARRTSPSNHTAMTSNNVWSSYTIKGTPPGYNKPVAMLVGPGAVSSGDQVALRIKYHPRVRIFGKPTNSAFNSPVTLNLHQDWFTRYSPSESYELKSPTAYLTHREFPIDVNVWLTREGVIQGRDDVVESAKNWINIFYGNSSVIFTDNAETGITKWVTNQGWGTIKSNATSPVNSFTDSPKGNYKNNADNTFTMKNPVNTSSFEAVVLSFKHLYKTQSFKDYCYVEVSSNNGSTWQEVSAFSGVISSMYEMKIDISKAANRSSSVKIRFRLKSDGSTNNDGWFIDDIAITGYTGNTSSPLSVDPNEIAGNYELYQNFPNPFNPETNISFSIPVKSNVEIKVYDIMGREIITLANSIYSQGIHSVRFDGTGLSSGIYFYKMNMINIESGEKFSDMKKMILVK